MNAPSAMSMMIQPRPRSDPRALRTSVVKAAAVSMATMAPRLSDRKMVAAPRTIAAVSSFTVFAGRELRYRVTRAGLTRRPEKASCSITRSKPSAAPIDRFMN